MYVEETANECVNACVKRKRRRKTHGEFFRNCVEVYSEGGEKKEGGREEDLNCVVVFLQPERHFFHR